MRTRRWISILLPLALIALLAYNLVRAAPRLESVFPPPEGGPVPASAPLQLTFSRPMVPETVAARLNLQPDQPGEYSWEGNTLTFTPADAWPAGETITVTLNSGAQPAELGLPLWGSHSWAFRVQRPRLAYLWPHDGPADLYALEPESGEVERLTTTAHGVQDFSLDQEGGVLFFSATNAQGGSDLYSLDRLTGEIERLEDCGPATCHLVHPSADGRWLAYQQAGPSGNPGSEILLLPLLEGNSDQPRRLASLSRPSDTLSWSPDGRLLFHDAGPGAFVLYDLASEEQTLLPNQTGAPGSWSPLGEAYVAPEIMAADTGNPTQQTLPSQLVRYDPQTGGHQDLTVDLATEDADPAFSPDGAWLAFARRFLDQTRWTPGRQAWLLPADGGEARPLTSAPPFNHTDFTWSPGGDRLAYTRFNQVTLTDPPEIWLVDADGANPLRLVIGGFDPLWLP